MSRYVRVVVVSLFVALLLGAVLTSVASAWGPSQSWGGYYPTNNWGCYNPCWQPATNWCWQPTTNWCWQPTTNWCWQPTTNWCYNPSWSSGYWWTGGARPF